ncbi:MAG TPA: family 16 glycosylhydrolase [Chitinophagaceae bacterium]|nr:family 16 glycosylhydrolase [Chitinophagaceae bacterium]
MLRLLILCAFVSFSSCSNGKDHHDTPTLSPTVKISDATLGRTSADAVCRFYVKLSAAADQPATVHYATGDGTARAGTDFTAQSGVLTFSPGETELNIDVKIGGDSLRQAAQTFYVQLSDPVNCTLATAKATGTITNDGTYLPTDTSGFYSPQSYPGYKLVWRDEFGGSSLNENDWNYETGGTGWGNNELENYTSRPQNVFLSSGNLVIEARKEDYQGSHYTSARITTQGKKEFTYGRIDIRAKIPVAKGMWPALWMLGGNISTVPWPACGETDIMELIGKNPSRVVGSFHWKKADGTEGTYNDTYNLTTGDFSQHFHVFSLLWGHDSLQILVDDVPYVKASREALTDGIYPFDKPFFLIFNVAVGGNWPGPPDHTTQFPQRMFVDYVRVFQKD